MGRNRSRSPRRDRRERDGDRRDREPRDRDRDRDRRREQRRKSRSRSPRRRRSRSFSPKRRSRSRERDGRADKSEAKSSKHMLVDRPQISEADLAGKSQDEIEMMKIMGFGGFESTKGKHVPGNDIYVANITRKRRYRQYMNRRGGFNRPLDFIA